MGDVSTKATGELIAETVDDLRMLIRKELELARVGLIESVRSRLLGAGLLVAAIVVVLPGLLFMILSLALWLPWSPQVDLAVTGVFLIGLALAGVVWGARKLKQKGEPHPSMDSLKEDARWARELLRH